MDTVIELIRNRSLTEEGKQDFKGRLAASFNVAQTAWDAYREHLVEHGILPESS
jgi:hypothetical protein